MSKKQVVGECGRFSAWRKSFDVSAKPKRSSVVKAKSVAMAVQSATPALPGTAPLLSDLRELILSARQQVAQTVNSGLTMLCWHIGTRIRKNILKEKRAEYGQEILQSSIAKLVAEFGRGLLPY